MESSSKQAIYIPISQDLVALVKRVDSFNDEEMHRVKDMLYTLFEREVAGIPRAELNRDKNGAAQELSPQAEETLQLTLKLHQMFALLDISLEKALSSESSAQEVLTDIITQLAQHGGLDYIPRERTPSGRMFEHASECKILLKHLHLLKTNEGGDPQSESAGPMNLSNTQVSSQIGKVLYVRLQRSTDQKESGISKVSSSSTIAESEDEDSGKTKEANTILVLEKDLLDLTLRANGKADLYFHAYFWSAFALHVYLLANQSNAKAAEDFETQVARSSIELHRLKGLAEFLKKVHLNIDKYTFTEETYNKYVNEFGGRKAPKLKKLLEELQRSLLFAQISDDKNQLYWIEKLLVQLLGYHEISVRDQVVVFLNMLYDGVDWQLTSAHKPVVRAVGQHFKVHITVNHDLEKDKNSQIFIGLSGPSPIPNVNKTILTWHRIDARNIVKAQGIDTEISINFGKFWKCGFYDWRIVLVQENGRLKPLEMLSKNDNQIIAQIRESLHASAPEGTPDYYSESLEDDLGSLAQGRYIVHAKGIRDQIFHEVQVDYQNAEIDTKEGKFIKRGDFSKVEKAIDSFKKRGITTLYMMGVLERDNNSYYNKSQNEVQYKRQDAAPLAITSRETANKMLGGDEGFQRVMQQAKQAKVKVIVDCLARISSSRSHRKYRDLMLSYLDEEGKKRICYGTDGQSLNYEDSAMLNYRKIEAWNLLIEEVLNFSKRHGISGINLDNGQAWPQINEADLDELMRLDVDGQPAYSPIDILNGEIVIRNENCGYWATNTIETYPNPFFIKMCKRLWEEIPDFMVIGECWGGFKFENRHIFLARSGIIPKMFKLPQALSTIFGNRLFKDGRVQQCEKDTIRALNDWHQSNKRSLLPEGTILLQSSSAHQWPYPAFLYGKGTWAAVDILYFMQDVPITFMGEIDGDVYRIESSKVFQHEQQEIKQGGLKRTNSQIMLALKNDNVKDDGEYQTVQTTSGAIAAYGSTTPQSQADGDSPDQISRRGLHKVRSSSLLAAVNVEQTKGSDLRLKEDKFKAEIGPSQGYDLSKISTHYEHRRRLRREKMVLCYGEYIPLVARIDQYKLDERVFTYARYSLQETAIIATNLNDSETQVYIDLTPLQKLYLTNYDLNTIVMVSDWLKSDSTPQYFFLKELLQMKEYIRLRPFQSAASGISICSNDPFVLKKTLTQSIERTKVKLTSGQSIESEQISLLFTEILERQPYDIVKFANVVGSLQENFLEKLNLRFYDLISHNHKLKSDSTLTSRLQALCQRIVEVSGDEAVEIAPVKAAKSIVLTNKLGPIIFCTPELGRWSTVGGLGVMVDELAYGLSLLGQDVYVISPYYERNRKGETGYLAKDPAGINYTQNISVTLDQKYTLGVHEGEVNGVKVIFLHHSEIFPSPYSDAGGCRSMVRQMAVFAKACLEFCCAKTILPSLCITNDWFTAMVPAYAKIGSFGEVFKGSTFLHICHNLEQTYEGRLFPNPGDGACEFIHQLPRDWFVDPQWGGQVIFNPSRCAIMLSDQWATVSPSYKEDLLRTSSLQGLLKQKPYPFAFPNGIPVEARIKKLNEVAPDHLTAKKLIQKKYFGYGDLDDSVPLLAFVGRITTQKGVHLILEAAERLIHKTQFKVNILVGGAANMREPYSARCAHQMWNLKNKYPNNFWADPDQFFTDGSLVNRGTDFGLMPSIFEPGGIVQHEFFVGGTPVIAFKTGGLKDSVFEFSWDKDEGNGYTFESHTIDDFIYACERALGTYKNKAKYLKLRENAFQSTMDGDRVSRAWLNEFFRLRDKIFVDADIIKDTLRKMGTWSPESYSPMTSLEEMFGIEKGVLANYALEDIDFGAEEEKEKLEEEPGKEKVVSHFENPKDDMLPHVFMMHNNGPRFQKVELCGSFDAWKTRFPMQFDGYTNQWFITKHLTRGKYLYKYVVNTNNWVVNEQEAREKDASGNLNNVLSL